MKLRKHVNSEMDKKRVSSEAGGSQKKSRLSAAACVGVSLILWGYLRWFGPGQDMQLAGGLVEREGYGGTQKEQELIVSGLGEEEQTVKKRRMMFFMKLWNSLGNRYWERTKVSTQ